MIRRIIAISALCLLFASVSALAAKKDSDIKKNPNVTTLKTAKSPATPTQSNPTSTVSEPKAEIAPQTGTTEIIPENSDPGTPILNSPEAGETINWQVISNGATNSSSASYALMGTIGQVAVGYVSSPTYGLNQGYWQDFGGSGTGCCGLYTGGFTGNTDCDILGKRNLADITRLIDKVYVSKTDLCCPENGNVDGDLLAKVNLADITRLIDHVYISKDQTSACQ